MDDASASMTMRPPGRTGTPEQEQREADKSANRLTHLGKEGFKLGTLGKDCHNLGRSDGTEGREEATRGNTAPTPAL